jgi:hypothetical protein
MNIISIIHRPNDSTGTQFVIQLDGQIQKEHLLQFIGAGYTTNDIAFTNVGIFYVCKEGIVSNTNFGNDCLYVTTALSDLLLEFEGILKSLIVIINNDPENEPDDSSNNSGSGSGDGYN